MEAVEAATYQICRHRVMGGYGRRRMSEPMPLLVATDDLPPSSIMGSVGAGVGCPASAMNLRGSAIGMTMKEGSPDALPSWCERGAPTSSTRATPSRWATLDAEGNDCAMAELNPASS
jgi:hypothetical protein